MSQPLEARRGSPQIIHFQRAAASRAAAGYLFFRYQRGDPGPQLYQSLRRIDDVVVGVVDGGVGRRLAERDFERLMKRILRGGGGAASLA